MLKRIFALVLTVCVLVVCIIPPAYASSAGAYGTVLLDNGYSLNVPYSAITDEYIIVKYTGWASPVFKNYGYMIWKFDDSISPEFLFEGSKQDFTLYTSDAYLTEYAALKNGTWDVKYYSNEAIDIEGHDNYEIVFSTFDFCNGFNGNLIYPKTPSTPGSSSTPSVSGDIEIVPSRSYDGILPSISDLIESGAEGVTNDWLVYRTLQNPTYDDNNFPVIDDSSKWIYWLAFLPDEHSIVFNEGSELVNSGGKYSDPSLVLNGGVITRYRLESPTFDGVAITDLVLNSSAGSSEWKYFGVDNDKTFLEYFSGWQYADELDFKSILDNIFVASSGSFVIPSAGPYYYTYWPENSGLQYIEYNTPTAYMVRTAYAGAVDSWTENFETEEDVSWLQRIYNAIVVGFDSVLDKLSQIIGVDEDNPALNDKGEDTDGDGEGDGFSLLDIIKNVFEFITDILGNIFGLLTDAISDIAGSIGGFFDSFKTDSGIFDFFKGTDDGNSAFSDVTDFFGFMRNLWSCIPTPVQTFACFAVGVFIYFGMMKMFH